jgi:hypothetical protein
MAEKKKFKPNDKEQSARFLETAKAVQAEDAKEKFEKATGRILKLKKSS